MKKLLLSLAIMLTAFSTLNAQDYNKGDWELGPMINIDANFKIKGDFDFQIGGGAGLYGNYAFTDVIKGIFETKYDFRWGTDGNLQYINVPALVCFKIGTGYIGVGAQYSFCIDGHGFSTGKLSYTSAIMEFSYKTKWASSGNYMIYSEEGFRNILRIGYAVTSIPYMASGGTLKYNPFLIEAVLRFDIAKYFTKNNLKAKRRRR